MPKEPSPPNYAPIDGGRTDGFMPSLRVLARTETQTASDGIWTRIADSFPTAITSCLTRVQSLRK